MSLLFPNTPAVDDQVVVNGITYTWDGTKWRGSISAGPAGVGVPPDGTAGQVLTKVDAANYNTTWTTPATEGGGGSGDVVGPAGAVDDRIATFDTTTGKLLQDGGKTVAELVAVADSTTTVLYDAGWPASRPTAQNVIAVGHTSAPSWLTADDVWFEAV